MGLGVEPRKAFLGSRKSFFLLAKCEAHLRGAVLGIVVEAGAGNDGDADFFDEKLRKAHIYGVRWKANRVRIREAGNIRHDVVRAPRLKHRESRACENIQQAFALS